jgi:hypothetical protein
MVDTVDMVDNPQATKAVSLGNYSGPNEVG